MSNVITWKTGQYSSHYGYVGGRKYFTYAMGFERGSKNPYVLRTSLPGIKKETQHATPNAAEQVAEQMLRIHLNSLVAAGVELPKSDHIDAGLDARQLEDTAQAIARVALRTEFEGDDEMWDVYWGKLPATERLSYRLKAQAALKA